MSQSKREYDANNWYQVHDNPLSKVGIFPYSGSQVGGDPSRVYNVYRPAEELSDPDTIESFKLVPFINNHTMLGDPDKDPGLTPVEEKGMEGVLGENIYFKDGTLYGNLKILSKNLASIIDDGKKELSLGYRCRYEIISGTWNGQPYDAIQRDIRGNHVALVDEGRMGKEVAVLDQLTFTFDNKEIQMSKLILDERMASVCDWVENRMAKDEAEEKEKKDKEAADAAASEEAEKKKAEDDAEEAEKKKEEKAGMDTKYNLVQAELDEYKKNGIKNLVSELSARNELAEKISHHVGTFDYADKTLAEVAEYGVAKLGLVCPKGSEKVALDGFLHKRTEIAKFGLDSTASNNSGKFNQFIQSISN